MESHPRPAPVDLTSRVLSIFSLIVAACSFAFLYSQYRQVGTRDDLLTAFNKQLGEEAKSFEQARTELQNKLQTTIATDEQRMEGWNTSLIDALASFRRDADRLLTEFDSAEKLASQQRQETFRTVLDEQTQRLAASATKPADDPLAAPKNQTDIADTRPEITDGTDSVLPAEVPAQATLTVVNTVLRPGTGNTTLVIVRNDSLQEAHIARVRFLPRSAFSTTDSLELTPDAETNSVTTISFDPSDNTSSQSGKHGVYDRKLQEPIRIAAGESITLRVTINEPQNKGWGFSGQLAVDYNAQKPLMVDSARVAFGG